MRKRANTIPQPFEIGQAKDGKVRVLLRENVRYLSETEVEYDEYSIHIRDEPNLEAQVQANLRGWIAYARNIEARPNASALARLEDKHVEELASLVDAIYKNDVEIFGLEEETENVQRNEKAD